MAVKQPWVWVRKHRLHRFSVALQQRMLCPQTVCARKGVGQQAGSPCCLLWWGWALGLQEPKPHVLPHPLHQGSRKESSGCENERRLQVEDGFLRCWFLPMSIQNGRYRLSPVWSLLILLVLVFFPLSCDSLFVPVLLFLSLSTFFFSLGFSLLSHVPVSFCCFSCCPSDVYRFPWLLYSTVPRTTFVYICSWNGYGKNSLKAMEIVREGSIMHCALLSWIAKRWKSCWLELTFPMSQSWPAAHKVDLEAWERTYLFE